MKGVDDDDNKAETKNPEGAEDEDIDEWLGKKDKGQKKKKKEKNVALKFEKELIN